MNQNGILPDHCIKELFQKGHLISAQDLDPDQIQPASLDLRLGKVAWRVRASFIPGASSTVSQKLQRLKLHEIDLSTTGILETGCVYIVPVLEELNLPEQISASANPKSSTGRLDVFTRIMTDYGQEFDKISSGYKGPLYIEISPRTFPVIVRSGTRLSQIRFNSGRAVLLEKELRDLHSSSTLVSGENPNISNGGIALSIDLCGGKDGIIGYRAKRHTDLIDMDRHAEKNIPEFWDPILRSRWDDLILDPNEFYILCSRESLHVPPLYAAEMAPFDPLVGEFRVHYAGFFDPGFGHATAGGTGSRAVLEVRSHEVPFILEHGQIMGRVAYEKLLSLPDRLYGMASGSNYQAQGLKLSKHFRTPEL